MVSKRPKNSKRDRFNGWVRDLAQSIRATETSSASQRPGGSQPPVPALPIPPMAAKSASLVPSSSDQVHNTNEQPTTPLPSLDDIAVAHASPRSSATSKFKQSGDTAWSMLETSLRALEKSADVFPTLKSVVGEFVACLDVVETAAANREDYEELATELNIVTEALKQYVGELGSEEHYPSLSYLVSSIETQVTHIKKQKGRGKARQLIQLTQDNEDVIKCHRKIEMLFRQLQNDVVLRTWRNTDKQRVELLLHSTSPADDARYDSSYSTIVKRRGCTKDTREKVQADLQNWIRDPHGAKVYWMNGMAGTGKTTIAYSLCEWLEWKKQLGASFFCSRVSAPCRDVNRIIPTIAYQFARYSPAFRSSLCRIMEINPDVGKLNVTRQFEKLIHQPMQEVKGAIPEDVVVVIDALDECESNYGVRLVLKTLLRFAKDLPLKFFVTSRPEPTITEGMQSPDGCLPSVLYLHDIEESVVEGDIKKYLIEALSPMLPPPSDNDITHLARRAGKLFIYAATAVRYIFPEDVLVDSFDRLQTVLKVDSGSAANEPIKRYDELNQLYSTVLASALSKSLEHHEVGNRQLVLRTVVCAKEPLSVSAIAALHGLSERNVLLAVQSLRSVLHLSDGSQLISTLHASFPDYLFDKLRSGYFCCDATSHSQLLASGCLEVMKEQLRFNICRLESSAVLDKKVPSLAQRIENFMTPVLFYACQYWGEHLCQASFSEALQIQIGDFLCNRLLFWMEVLNLRQCGRIAAQVFPQISDWLAQSTSGSTTDTQQQLLEAQDFTIRFFSNACSQSTPHIYVSALPFSFKNSMIYKSYWGCMRNLMDVKGTVLDQKRQHLITIWATGLGIEVLAVSHNGILIAFATAKDEIFSSNDIDGNSVHVWDTRTGKSAIGPLAGHTRHVKSLAFSPDDELLASGSHDTTIRVWNLHTSSTISEPFKGHTFSVNSVAFSPDGTRIISSSSEGAIRVWEVYTGITIAGPFPIHEFRSSSITDYSSDDSISGSPGGPTPRVNCVAFSPDGTSVASSHSDGSIILWDVCAANINARPLVGHESSVNSVTFSSDGISIVSGSGTVVRPALDSTIRIWDVRTGKTIVGPLRGHSGGVNSVAFSSDSTRVVSGSNDKTVRVWDARTGETIAGPFKGHEAAVNSVAFSPSGKQVFSGSYDATIRVWDAYVGNETVEPSKGHLYPITSVVFSPDGMAIASGSYDATIRVWDANSGTTVVGPLTGHTSRVHSVAFSPSGTHLASGSRDSTIRVWDASTGRMTTAPFQHGGALINSVAFSPGGTRIVSGSYGGAIRVWDAYTGSIITNLFVGDKSEVKSVAFSPDGTRIVSGTNGGTIRVWDAATGTTIIGPLRYHTGGVNSVAFSPDGERIVSGSNDNTIRVWDARTGDTIVGPLRGHESAVTSVAFSPDGTRIASGSGDRTVQLWDAYTGDNIDGLYDGHTGTINGVAFSPDGTRIASCSESNEDRDHQIRLWNYQQGKLHPALTDAWSFHPDGWITTNDTPLFWVSPELHGYMPYPGETLVIKSHGSLAINYQDLALGESWTECYISKQGTTGRPMGIASP